MIDDEVKNKNIQIMAYMERDCINKNLLAYSISIFVLDYFSVQWGHLFFFYPKFTKFMFLFITSSSYSYAELKPLYESFLSLFFYNSPSNILFYVSKFFMVS